MAHCGNRDRADVGNAKLERFSFAYAAGAAAKEPRIDADEHRSKWFSSALICVYLWLFRSDGKQFKHLSQKFFGQRIGYNYRLS